MSASGPPARILVIANPVSGGGRSRVQAPQLVAALAELGTTAELYFTEKSGDAARRAAQVTRDAFDGVVSVGGDGTLNEVLNGLPDPTIPLGILAMGTANVLALELGLPREPRGLAAVIAGGKLQDAAIGSVAGRRFLLFVSSGLDADIVKRVEEVRTGTLGKLRWTGPVLHVIRRWPVADRKIITDEGETIDALTTVVVSRVATYGGILGLPGDAHLGDGWLHVFGFRQRSRWAYLRAVLRALRGKLRAPEDVIHLKTRGLRIETSEAAVWQVDGDLGGTGSVRVELLTKQAQLYRP